MNILSLLPLAVTLSGAYFLFRLRFFFILRPKKTLKKAMTAAGGKNALPSLSLALAGTLGVGNIVGVAVGISVGGAGSVFWLLFSSLFAMIIKYCESVVSSDMGEGLGMIGVIEKSFGRFSRHLSLLYSALALILSFVMGAALQSASIGQSAALGFSLSPLKTAVILLVMLLVPIIIGSKKIEKITVIIIPLATIIYIFLALSTIISNVEKVIPAVKSIFSSAFSAEGIGGGVLGFLVSDKIKEGYLRGILSNEAGAGTSSLAHARNGTSDAASVGIMGMSEVFFDTVVLCMITALATLVSVDSFSGKSGVFIILSGIGSVFGEISEYLVFICIFAFAYSTIVCWYYYGGCASRYLFRSKSGEILFSVTFLAFALCGVLVKGDALIKITDFILLGLSLISLSALMKNSDRIVLLSEKSGIIDLKR